MKLLIAEDDPVTRRSLEVILAKRGHEICLALDGEEAWRILQSPTPPELAIMDWQMPGLSGPEVCQRVRATEATRHVYLVLLTARGAKEDIVAGLRAGANDYVTKPFDREELLARIQVGERVVQLQSELARRVRELEAALASVQQLQGLLPICSYCKKIRDDGNYWHQVENYIGQHTTAQFSHGVCPECYDKVIADLDALGRLTPGLTQS